MQRQKSRQIRTVLRKSIAAERLAVSGSRRQAESLRSMKKTFDVDFPTQQHGLCGMINGQ